MTNTCQLCGLKLTLCECADHALDRDEYYYELARRQTV